MGVYYTLINLCSIPSIFPPFPLVHSFQQVAIIIILQVSQYWHVCYRQTTKDHDSPLSQNLSITNNSSLKNRAWWAPSSMAYCQQGSAGNYSYCDCKVASDAEDTTYQPFTLSSGSNILSGPSSATFPEFCLVLLMLNSREEASSTVIAYFSYTLQLRNMVGLLLLFTMFLSSHSCGQPRGLTGACIIWGELLKPPLSQAGTRNSPAI